MSELDGVFYKEIVEQGLREFPNECCGVIAAADGVPVKVFPMTNADASPVTYRLDGKEQLRVFDEIDERGLGAVGDLPLAHALRGLPERDRHRGSRSTPRRATSSLSLADREEPVAPVVLHPRRRGHRRGADRSHERPADRRCSPRTRCSATRATSSCPTSAGRVSASCSTLGAGDRRRRTRLAGRDVPGRRRHRQARHRRLRRGRRLQPAAPDPAHRRRRRPPQGRVRGRAPARDQPDDRDRRPRHAAVLDERLRRVRALRRRSSTAPTTSRCATS